MRKQPAITAIAIFSAGFYALQALSAQAQTYKADDIVKHFQPAVQPPSATRGLCIGTEADCSRAGHVVKPATAAAFDLVVRFKYNSDVLEPDARINLDEFAKALKTPQLESSSFVVEGHTDATGTPTYNPRAVRAAGPGGGALSQRGAASRRRSSRPAATARISPSSPTRSPARTGASRRG